MTNVEGRLQGRESARGKKEEKATGNITGVSEGEK